MILKRWAIILGISAIVVYGAFWAATHPSDPFSWKFTVGVIVFFILLYVVNLFRRLSKLSSTNLFSKSREPSDPIYRELKTLFREKLLPLNFREEEVNDGRGKFVVTYTRGQSSIQLEFLRYKDEIETTFSTLNPFSNVHKWTLYLDAQDKENFKVEAINKFEQWLTKQ